MIKIKGRHELTESAIREVHQPSNHYRIQVETYSPGTTFGGKRRAGLIYIMRGRCRLVTDGNSVDAGEGEVLEIEADGEYDFTTLGESEVQYVSVWLLPEAFRTT